MQQIDVVVPWSPPTPPPPPPKKNPPKIPSLPTQALPCLSESELPPAVGLALKLASGGPSCRRVVGAVRRRLAALSPHAPAGPFEALRLAALQHPGVGRAVMADIQAQFGVDAAEGDGAQQEEGGEEGKGSAATAVSALGEGEKGGQAQAATPQKPSTSDLNVLLDMLSLPGTEEQAQAHRCLAQLMHRRLVGDEEMKQLIRGRQSPKSRGQQQQQQQQPSTDVAEAAAAAGAGADGSVPAGASPPEEHEPHAWVESAAQRVFLQFALSGPLLSIENKPMSASSAAALDLHFPQRLQLAGLPPVAAPAAADELGGVLFWVERLLEDALLPGIAKHAKQATPVPGERSLGLAATLLDAVFDACTDEPSRMRVFRFLSDKVVAAAAKPDLTATSPEQHQHHHQQQQQQQQQVAKQQQHQQQQSALAAAGAAAAAAAAAATGGTADAPALGSGKHSGSPEEPAAARLISTLILHHPDAAPVAVSAALAAAFAGARGTRDAKAAAAAAASASAAALEAERARTALMAAKVKHSEEGLAEAEARFARAEAEHRAELAGAACDRKELAARVRNLEQQLEWARSEREEERGARARDAKEAAQRAAESDSRLRRLREEHKRLQKEKGALADRVKVRERGGWEEKGGARRDSWLLCTRGEQWKGWVCESAVMVHAPWPCTKRICDPSTRARTRTHSLAGAGRRSFSRGSGFCSPAFRCRGCRVGCRPAGRARPR